MGSRSATCWQGLLAQFYPNTPPQLRPLGIMLVFAFTWGLGGGLPEDARQVLDDTLKQRFAGNSDFDLPVRLAPSPRDSGMCALCGEQLDAVLAG